MNEPLPASVLDAQLNGLLQRVHRDRDERCSQMRASAQWQAREILRSAHAEARASMRKAITLERSRLAQALHQAEARAQLEARGRAQHDARAALQNMWAAIPAALEARWRDPASRQLWIEAALRQAGRLLTGQSWRMEQAGEWSAEERDSLEASARSHGASGIELASDAGLSAGLRIRCRRVCLDATIAGLLVHRQDIESAFLAEYVETESKGA